MMFSGEKLEKELKNVDIAESSMKQMSNPHTFGVSEELIPLAELVCNDNTPLLVALWTVWGAIMQAHNVDPYNEQVASLYSVCKEAMEHAKQMPPEGVTDGNTETGC